ncbi:MAG: DNA damage-inducible protein 1 [Caeruleum heppii]|nr:MAG: DNA damage-inducible protein 1 [Caeruleum heppii]
MMRITISINAPDHAVGDDILSLDVPDDNTLAQLRAVISAQTSFPPTSQHIYHNGQLLTDDTNHLDAIGVKDGEMLAMHVRDLVAPTGTTTASNPAPASSVPSRPFIPPSGDSTERDIGGPDPEQIRQQLLANAVAREELRKSNPELADAAEDPQRFVHIFRTLQRQELDAAQARQREIARLHEDPFDVEAQRKIEEMINQEAITQNLQNALEHHPEAFGRVTMLYIDVEVNGHKVKAFVDSGAQATIMSPACAENCGITRLIDKRFAGIARGVGTARILGRVTYAQIKIGSLFLPCSFTVMEGKEVELLLGLDMLKSFQARLDLRKGSLMIGDIEVPFLGEADIPKLPDEVLNEPTIAGPGGTRVGGRSGAVLPAAGSTGPSTGTAPAPRPNTATSQGPTPRQQAPAAATPAPSQTTTTYPPESIAQLQGLGFSRDDAIAALNATGGDVDYAAGLLFQEP